MKHKHAKSMMLYAQDAMETDKPWERWQFKHKLHDTWCDFSDHPTWIDTHEYRQKQNTIVINGHDVPEPIKTPLMDGATYFVPVIDVQDRLYDWYSWDGDSYDYLLLERGLIHMTEENAIKHSEALLSFNKGKDNI